MVILTMEINTEERRIETKVRKIDEKNKLQEFYKYLHCDVIDMVEIEVVENKVSYYYDVICDDEGLLKSPKVPVLYVNEDLVIFGSCAFCKYDTNGDSIGLETKDIDRLMRYIHRQTKKMDDWYMRMIFRKIANQ